MESPFIVIAKLEEEIKKANGKDIPVNSENLAYLLRTCKTYIMLNVTNGITNR